TLRPLLQKLFGASLEPGELQELIALTFYPRETLARARLKLGDSAAEHDYCRRHLPCLFEIIRTLAPRYNSDRVRSVMPREFAGLLEELLHRNQGRGTEYYDAMIESLAKQGRALHFVHLVVRMIRNLAIDELVIGGDC